MTSCNADNIRKRLLEFCTLMSFNYKGHYCDIDPFNSKKFRVTCDEQEFELDSIEKVMTEPLFLGCRLCDIAGDIEVLDW